MNIRVLKQTEIAEASKIIENQWGKEYSEYFVVEATKILHDPANAIYGKFSDTGELLGLGMIIKDQIDYSLWGITWVVVAEELRGRGIGSELLNELENFAVTRQFDYPSQDCVVLLTTTIPKFYTERGYQNISEWKTTTLMLKDLTTRANQTLNKQPSK